MKSVKIFVLVLSLLYEAQSIKLNHSFPCYYTGYVVYIELTCQFDGISRMSMCLDSTKLFQLDTEMIKHACHYDWDSMNRHADEFDDSKNLSVLDTLSLGIDIIELIRSEAHNSHIELKVTRWNAAHNRLTNIPNSILDLMPKLEEIDFSHNYIEGIKGVSLSKSIELEKLILDHNNISSIDKDAFKENKKLKILNLGYNPLKSFNSDLLSSLYKLEILDLSHTHIEQIDDNCFTYNSNMMQLNLRGNQLKIFNFNIFPQNAKLVEVHLPSRNIEKLDISCVKSICHFKHFNQDNFFENIHVFNASGNRKQNISKLLSKIGVKVAVLDLSWNTIEILDSSLLQRFTNLQYLNLSHSKVSKITSNAFRSQSHLRLLDLTHNNLKGIDSAIFHSKLENENLIGSQSSRFDKIVSTILKTHEMLLRKHSGRLFLNDILKLRKDYYEMIDGENDVTSQESVTEDTSVETIDMTSTLESITFDSTTNSILATTIETYDQQDSTRHLPEYINENSSTLLLYVIMSIVFTVIITTIVLVIWYFFLRKPIDYTNIAENISLNTFTTSIMSTEFIEIDKNAPAQKKITNYYEDIHKHIGWILSNQYATVYHHSDMYSKQ